MPRTALHSEHATFPSLDRPTWVYLNTQDIYLNIFAMVLVCSQGSVRAFVKKFGSNLFSPYCQCLDPPDTQSQPIPPNLPFCFALITSSGADPSTAVAWKEHIMVDVVTVPYLL